MQTYQILLYFTAFSIQCNAEFGMEKPMDKNSYGPYTVHVKDLVTCADEVKKKGPQKKPLATYNVTPVVDGTTVMTIVIHQNINLDKCPSRVSLYSITKDAKNTVFNYNIKSICSHFGLGPFFKLFLKLSDDCYLRKSSIQFKVNVTEMNMKFNGDKFFYGEFQYKSVFRCNGQTLFCFLTDLFYEKINVKV